MIQAFTLNEKNQWTYYIQQCLGYDFYHTWSYHALNSEGEPMLFVYREGDAFIAFPLIKRKIENSPYYDLTSAYGYCGPISNMRSEDLSEVFLNNFKNAFLDYLKSGNFISVFSRLNPFLNQKTLLERFGGVYDNGCTVALDLTISYQEQRAKYKKEFASSIKQLRNKGFKVREGNCADDSDLFVTLYSENMARVNATDSYYFDKKFIDQFLSSDDFSSGLLFIEKDGEPVCGSLNTFNNGIIQGHLIGTKAAFLPLSPARLMVDEISIIGREKNMKYFHMGGGRGFKKDSLFSWKAAFSDLVLPYYSWRFIANEQAYNALLASFPVDSSSEVDFFPLYRYQFAEV
jgi:hypothetical protein